MIRLTIPSIEDDDIKAVTDILESGYLVQGAKVAEFEKTVADYVGTKYAVAVSNCTAALHLTLLTLDVRIRDIVVVTSYSWIATANVIELCGAQPVFVDIRPDTFNMAPDSLKRVLNRLMSVKETARRVKAVLPVHTFGQIADMPEILEIAGRYDLPVIEDAACALGSLLNGRQSGSWGKTGCFSFHPRKAITTGEGGIITTNDAEIDRKLRSLRNHGLDPDSVKPDFIMPGFNYRMTEFQAALGITQMAKLNRIIAARQQKAAIYNDLLYDTLLQPPAASHSASHIYQSYVVLLPESVSSERSVIIEALKEKGIETTIGTLNMPMTTYFQNRYGFKTGDFPITDSICSRSLTLPLHEKLSETKQNRIIETILKRLAYDRRLH